MKLPPEKALLAHKFRVDLLPIKYNQFIILKSKEPTNLSYEIQKNDKIDELILSSDLLTVMKYENGAIVIDAISSKIEKRDKIYGMSMSKGLIGYLVGHVVKNTFQVWMMSFPNMSRKLNKQYIKTQR